MTTRTIVPTAEKTTRQALYCRRTGRRLAPDEGATPEAGAAVAVIVLDNGDSMPLFGDAVIGRGPGIDRRVQAGKARPILLADLNRTISRAHLLLRVQGFQFEVIDLGSSNGTALWSGEEWIPVLPGIGHAVADGERIRIAARTLTLYHLRR